MTPQRTAFEKLAEGMKPDIFYEPESMEEMLTWMVVSLSAQERKAALTYVHGVLSVADPGAAAQEAWNSAANAYVLLHDKEGAERLFRALERRLSDLGDAPTHG